MNKDIFGPTAEKWSPEEWTSLVNVYLRGLEVLCFWRYTDTFIEIIFDPGISLSFENNGEPYLYSSISFGFFEGSLCLWPPNGVDPPANNSDIHEWQIFEPTGVVDRFPCDDLEVDDVMLGIDLDESCEISCRLRNCTLCSLTSPNDYEYILEFNGERSLRLIMHAPHKKISLELNGFD